MYTDFYELREKPFALTPDPQFLYLSLSHREALAHVLYGVDQGEGFICVTGEVGTGKTTLCRTLLDRLGPDTEVAFVFNPPTSGEDLLRAINSEFGLQVEGRSRAEMAEQLNEFLLVQKKKRRRVLLIIDEAQNLSTATLEEVRLLSNLGTSRSKLIQILLFGQPELDALLDSRDLRQLRQRISVRWALKPLSASETREYVDHRLRVASGGDSHLFTDAALREVWRRTRGTPRLVNLLCDRSLLAGYAEGAQRIGRPQVTQAAREILGAHRRARGWRARILPVLVTAFLALSGGFVAWSQLRDDSTPPPVSARSAVDVSAEPAVEPASLSAPVSESGPG